MNECTMIFAIDILFVLNGSMNAGNVNDVDINGQQYNLGTLGSESKLMRAEQTIGLFYITLFMGNMITQISIILYNQIRLLKLQCRKNKAIWMRNEKRERAF